MAVVEHYIEVIAEADLAARLPALGGEGWTFVQALLSRATLRTGREYRCIFTHTQGGR